jgi:hypothetical protein
MRRFFASSALSLQHLTSVWLCYANTPSQAVCVSRRYAQAKWWAAPASSWADPNRVNFASRTCCAIWKTSCTIGTSPTRLLNIKWTQRSLHFSCYKLDITFRCNELHWSVCVLDWNYRLFISEFSHPESFAIKLHINENDSINNKQHGK